MPDAWTDLTLAIRIRCNYGHLMRTTLDIDPDVLAAAKEMARRSRSTAGQIISDLARKALIFNGLPASETKLLKNGFEILPADNRVVTPELVEKLMLESES